MDEPFSENINSDEDFENPVQASAASSDVGYQLEEESSITQSSDDLLQDEVNEASVLQANSAKRRLFDVSPISVNHKVNMCP